MGDKLMKVIGLLFTAFIVVVVSIIMYGITLQVIWNWYIPITLGWNSITIPQALGLSMIAGVFKMGLAVDKNEDIKGKSYYERAFTIFLGQIMGCLATILIAWIVLQFV